MPGTGDDAQPLEGLDKDRWDAATSQIQALGDALGEGTLDDEGLQASLAAVAQVPLGMEKITNALHMPSDAGEWADGLERILRRIPDGWVRWISCGAGWYPLIIETAKAIEELVPDYEIHQIKEKYGTLRFYWEAPWLPSPCCAAFDLTDPRPFDEAVSGPYVPADRTPERQAIMDAWIARSRAHSESEECAHITDEFYESPEMLARQEHIERAEALVDAAERRSETICERCGASGSLRVSAGWYKTLCDSCAETF